MRFSKRTSIWLALVPLWGLFAIGAWHFFAAAPKTPATQVPAIADRTDQPEKNESSPLNPRHETPDPDPRPEAPKTTHNETPEKRSKELPEKSGSEPGKTPVKPPVQPETAEYIVPRETKRKLSPGTTLGGLRVEPNSTLELPSGDVTITGDIHIEGKLVRPVDSRVILDGNVTVTGNAGLSRAIVRNGTTRVRNSVNSGNGENVAKPGESNLYVEKGATLIIEKDGAWSATTAYGYQIAGTLIIDGGTFNCTFANGNGKEHEDSWLPGSELIINGGRFIGSGDHDFTGASITIHDGSLEVNDDIWGLGDSLVMYGGLLRNTTGGGMFSINGNFNMTGGVVQVHQSSHRSLRILATASVYCSGGEVQILGSAAGGGTGGIGLYGSATFNKAVFRTNSHVAEGSSKEASLMITELNIDKGKRFDAKGFNVNAGFYPSDEQGEFLP